MRDVVVGDFDGDGRQDLAVSYVPDRTTMTLRVLRNEGADSWVSRRSLALAPGTLLAAGRFEGLQSDLVVVGLGEGSTIRLAILEGDAVQMLSEVETAVPEADGVQYGQPTVADVDGDGDVDILMPGSTEALVLENRGNAWRARYLSANGAGGTPVVGDFDGDEEPEVLLSSATGAWVVDDQDTQSPPVLFYPVAGFFLHAVAVDLDSDGRDDLVGRGESGLAIARGGLSQGASSPYFSLVHSIMVEPTHRVLAVANLGAGPELDIAVGQRGADRLHLLVNEGLGALTASEPLRLPEGGLEALVSGDFDGDGVQDLVAAMDSKTLLFLAGADSERIQRTALPSFVFDLHLVDFDDDGRLDLIASGDALLFLRGEGDGSFSVQEQRSGGGGYIASGDLDRDGFVDVVVPHFSESGPAATAYFGSQDGFTSAVDLDVPLSALGAAIWDFDGDGLGDLVVASYDANRVTVLRQISPRSFATTAQVDFMGPRVVQVGDLTGDGLGDLVVGGDGTTRLFPGVPGGTFAALKRLGGGNVVELIVDDLNGDDVLDVIHLSTGFGVTVSYGACAP